MELTITISNGLKISVFELMAQDIDEVILFVNHLLERADEIEKPVENPRPKPVGDDGFWNF